MRNKKRKDGRYKVSVYTGTVDGNARYKYFYSTSLNEAQAAADEYRRKLHSVSDPGHALFRHLASAWLENKKKTVGASQGKTLEGFVHVMNGAIGDVPVLEITEEMLTDFLCNLAAENPHTGKPSSQATLQKYHQAIRAIFRYSRIRPNPSEYLEIPKGRKRKDRRALTEIEQQRVRELKHRARLPAMLAMYAGLRRGEITALLWQDITDDTITVNKSFDFVEGKVKPPKTAAGSREIHIPPLLRDYLRTVKRGKPSDPVVTSDGKMMTISAWRRLWESYMTDMDVAYGGRVKYAPKNVTGVYSIQPFTLHELRHTYATILRDAGVDIKVAQTWIGHSDASTTMNIYTHLSETQKRTAAGKMDAFLSASTGHDVGQRSANMP